MSKLPDSNDLLKSGQLPADPMAGTKPVTKPNGKKHPAVDEPPPGLFVDDDPAEKDHPLAAQVHQQSVRLTPSARALLLGEIITRAPCGIDTLDNACRGGLPAKKRIFFVGGPGCLKSAVMIVVSVKLLLAGWHVAIIAADEPANDVLIRIGRALGFDRDALEDGKHPYHEETKAKFAELLARYPLTLVDDGDDPEPEIEAVARDLADRAKGAPSCLCVDSIQQARSLSSGEADGPRSATDSKIVAIKYASDVCGHLVLATSEANRSWSSARKENRIEAVGAGKESSAIEYASHLQIAMSTVKDEPDMIDCVVAKNRLGGKRGVEFRLQWNADNHSIVEVESEEEEDPKRRPPRDKHAALMALSVKVEEYIRLHPGAASRKVCADVQGTDTRILAALDELVELGRIERREGKCGGKAWFVTEGSSTDAG